MTIAFGKHILNLLKKHECVVLPTIGALVLKENPAYVAAGQVFPSSKSIHFNKNIVKEDHLLITELVNQEKINFLEAKLKVDGFLNKIKFSLNIDRVFDITQLGRFDKHNGEIRFTEDTTLENLDKNSFGLKSIGLHPIQRDIIRDIKISKVSSTVEVKENKVVSNTKKSKNRRLVPMIGLAASFVLIMVLSSLMISDTNFEPLEMQDANVLNFLIPSKSNVTTAELKPIVSNRITMPSIESNSRLLEEGIDNTNTKVINTSSFEKIYKINTQNPKGYYVIIGAFSKKKNALKAQNDCVFSNNCALFKSKKGLYRVGVFISETKVEAIQKMPKYKKENKSFWLLENI